METAYQALIAAVSTEVANTFLATEDNLAARATLLDADIAEITRQIGLATTKKVLEQVCDDLVKKNRTTALSSKSAPSSASTVSSAH